MTFHPVVEHIPILPVLDPIWLLAFTCAFLASAWLVMRRPVYGAAMLALVTPFAFAHAIAGTAITLEKAVLIGVLAGLGAGARRFGATALPRAILVAFAVLVAADLLSGVDARYPVEVVRESLKWVEYAAYFIAAFVCYRLDPQPRVVRAALSLSVIVVCVTALAELFFGAGSDLIAGGHVLPRIAGALEGPNQLGGYLEVVLAALCAWEVRDPMRGGAWLTALAGVVLALCFSRAALAGVAVVVIVIASVEGARVRALWTLVAGIALGYGVTLVATPGLHAETLLGAIAGERTSDVDAHMSGGVGSRIELWRAALVLFRRHPLLGVGAGNYQYDLARAGLYGVRTQANNWYLQALAEGGIVLLAATIAWIACVARALLPGLRRSAWSLGAFAATCAMIVHGFSDDLLFYPKVAEMWMLLIALGCVPANDPS